MYVLGIGCYYHDSSATLLKDGVLIAAAEEERFSRKKHDSDFPINAINFCLAEAGITIDKVNYIAFYEKPFLKFERLLSQHIYSYPRSFWTFFQAMPSWINEKLRIIKTIKKKLKFVGDVFFVQHHMAHAASSYLVSPYDKAAILTVDGVGEWTTTAYGVGKGNDITLLKHIEFPHSVGLIYSTITAYLGFSVNNSEYKVMGLAPYGNMDRKTNKYYHKIKNIVDLKDDGSFHLDMSYFVYHYKSTMPSRKLCKLLGGPVNKRDGPINKRHSDIAAAVQLLTEDMMTSMLNHLHKQTKMDSVVISGGVALNSVYNGKILRNTPFKNIWIQPNSSDGGASLGAAFYLYNTILGKKRVYEMKTAYTGPSYSDDEIKAYLLKNKINYSEFSSDDELCKKTAKLIYSGNVIGWMQGKMEWGPRALGARSIISDATNPKMQEILNLKVKHREKFRPFAPAVCEDDALTYFDCDDPIPQPTDYMLMVYPVKPEWRKKIPAVTHVDGSGRLQTVRREQNARYYDLMKEFGKLSGIPIVINTSFNIRGEPIVCTPNDAYRCMMGTGIDYLVMGKFLIKRSNNKKDMWDSEELAKD